MYLADYHTHTQFSPDAHDPMTVMAQAALDAGMDEICFTDHVEPLTWGSNELRPPYDWSGLTADFANVQAALGDRIHLRLGMNDNIYYGGHIGYGVRERARGHGIAARACRIVAPLARAHDMEELIITTTPDNVASIKTIEHLGASFEGNVGVPRYHDLYRRGDKVVSRYVWNISGVPPLTGLTPLVPTDWSDAVEQPFRGIF